MFWLCLLVLQAEAQVVIEDFSGPNPLSRWTFSNGAEFPGATGNLTLSNTPWGANCGHLTYNFQKGGRYVAGLHNLPQSLSVAWISMALRSPACVHPALRVVDATGQTLQFSDLRPLENSQNESEWYASVLDIRKSTSFWGGANDGTLHGNITSLALLAADACEPNSVGNLDFTKLVAYSSPQPFEPHPQSQANDVGPLAPRTGVNIHFLDDTHALDIVHSVDIHFVRMDLIWTAVERTKGIYDFSKHDVLVNELSIRNMSAHFIFDYFNPLYNPPSCPSCSPATPEAVQAFAAFAAAAASHFKGRAESFEVWNEPNIGFWQPKPDPEAYRVLLAATVQAVKKANAGARVSSGGVSTFDFAFLREGVLQSKAGGADAIGVHPYRQGSPETAGTDFLYLRSLVREQVGAVPVLDTEWGYSSTWFGGDGHAASARQQQAVLGFRRVLTSWSLDCPLLVYYDIRDDGNNASYGEDNFGMLAEDYSDKPLMSAYRTLSQRIKGMSGAFLKRPLLATEGLWLSGVHAFQIGTSQIIVWIETGEVVVQLPSSSRAFSMYGAPLSLKPLGGMQQLVVTDGGGPVYVTY